MYFSVLWAGTKIHPHVCFPGYSLPTKKTGTPAVRLCYLCWVFCLMILPVTLSTLCLLWIFPLKPLAHVPLCLILLPILSLYLSLYCAPYLGVSRWLKNLDPFLLARSALLSALITMRHFNILFTILSSIIYCVSALKDTFFITVEMHAVNILSDPYCQLLN